MAISADIELKKIMELPVKGNDDASRDWIAASQAPGAGTNARKTVRRAYPEGAPSGAIYVDDDGYITLALDASKLFVDEYGKLSTHGAGYDNGPGIEINGDRISVMYGNGLTLRDNRIVFNGGVGFDVDELGRVSVAAGTGLKVDSEGVAIDYTEDTANPAEGKPWSASVAKRYVDEKSFKHSYFSGHSEAVAGSVGRTQVAFVADMVPVNCSLSADGKTVLVGTTGNMPTACVLNASIEFSFPSISNNKSIILVDVCGVKHSVDSTKPSTIIPVVGKNFYPTGNEPIAVTLAYEVIQPEEQETYPEFTVSVTADIFSV